MVKATSPLFELDTSEPPAAAVEESKSASLTPAPPPPPPPSRTESFPIAQEQLEKHSQMSTEDLVKEVKEYLNANSISQRQFGEKILGLSQGSVSDLLARPKAWELLTQKGREPFIRMRIFLDEAAKHASGESTSFASLLDDLHSSASASSGESGGALSIDETSDAAGKRRLTNEEAADEENKADGELLIDEFDAVELCVRVKECLANEGITSAIFTKHYLPKQAADVEAFMRRPEACTNASLLAKLTEFLSDIVSGLTFTKTRLQSSSRFSGRRRAAS